MVNGNDSKINSSYTAHNNVRLVSGGREYFDLLEKLIDQAKDTIHLQVYIYDADDTGKRIAQALLSAAKRSVKVYLMADGYASKSISPSFIEELTAGGIHFRFFEPLFKGSNFYLGRRLHHKVMVVDAAIAMVGGINISNHYNDMPGKPAWLDFALLVQGDVTKDLCTLCWKTWKGYQSDYSRAPCTIPITVIALQEAEIAEVRIRRNDWVRRKKQISKSYIEMMTTAQSEIIILCSYFLPGTIMRRNIKRAVSRGVKVKVVVAGKSDLLVAKNAEKFLYDWLLRNNIEIYEYQNNILHGKIAVCDSKWVTIGSYNVNDISAYASVELNLDVNNELFAKKVEIILNNIITTNCSAITKESHIKSKNVIKQFFRWVSYELFRITFHVFTFYFQQKK
jgi:cardiolipin synthase